MMIPYSYKEDIRPEAKCMYIKPQVIENVKHYLVFINTMNWGFKNLFYRNKALKKPLI